MLYVLLQYSNYGLISHIGIDFACFLLLFDNKDIVGCSLGGYRRSSCSVYGCCGKNSLSTLTLMNRNVGDDGFWSR